MVLLKPVNIKQMNKILHVRTIRLFFNPQRCISATSTLQNNVISDKLEQRHSVGTSINKPNEILHQQRYQCTKTDNIIKPEEFRLIYEGPLGTKIRLLKLFSLSTATVSIVCAPLFILFGKQSIPFIGKALMGGTVLFMGVTTTMIMHWLTRVYVHKMYFDADSKTFAAETSSLIGTFKRHTFNVADIVVPEIENAFSTFEAKGSKFFIHMELKEAEQIMKYVQEHNYEQL